MAGPIPARDPWFYELPLGFITAGEQAAMYTNRNWKGDGTVMGFIYFAGKSAGHANIVGGGFIQELACRGYPTICGDLGDITSQFLTVDGPGVWGADGALAKAEALRVWLTTPSAGSTYVPGVSGGYGCKPGKVGVLGGSHGGIGVYAYARNYINNVALIASAIPTADVEHIRTTAVPAWAPSIEGAAAYGSAAAWQAARPTHNPVEVAAYVSAAGIPQLSYYSATDPVCVLSTQQALKAAAGAKLDQRNLGNIGHSFNGLGPRQPGGNTQQIIDFADWVEANIP